MLSSLINPLDLPLTPPMDLNSNLPSIDKISPFPMQLRTRASVGLFETRRGVGVVNGNQGLIRAHHGIDLLAPIGTKIFASAEGTVIGGSGSSILILHDFGFKFLTFYQHLQNRLVATGDRVVSGQHIAEVEDFPNSSEDHLHFELRYPFDTATPSYANSLPINPTFAMYQWEVKTFQNNDKSRHVVDKVTIASFEEIVRARQLRFIMCNVEGGKRDLFLPLQTGLPEDDSLAETLRQAFFSGKKVRIVWRESLFFSTIQSTHAKASIIVEVKVYR